MSARMLVLAFVAATGCAQAQEPRTAEAIVRASCAACHGPQGNTPASPDYPRLGGQHREYVEKALNDYISGRRKDPVMRMQVVDAKTGEALLSQPEIGRLAEYFAAQKGLTVK
jgi:cytochrome c553